MEGPSSFSNATGMPRLWQVSVALVRALLQLSKLETPQTEIHPSSGWQPELPAEL